MTVVELHDRGPVGGLPGRCLGVYGGDGAAVPGLAVLVGEEDKLTHSSPRSMSPVMRTAAASTYAHSRRWASATAASILTS